MIFEQIQADGDRNFAYLIGDDSTHEAAIVDPSYAPQRTLDHATRHGLSVRHIRLAGAQKLQPTPQAQ